MYLRLLSYLRPYIGRVALAFLATALFAAFSGVSLGMIIPLAHVLARGGDLAATTSILPDAGSGRPEGLAGTDSDRLPTAVGDARARVRAALVSIFQGRTPAESLRRICLGLLGLFFLKFIFGYAQAFLGVWLEQVVVRDLRNDIYAKLTHLSLAYFHRRRVGEIMSRVTYDVTLVRMAVNSFFTVLVRDLSLTVVFVAIVLWVNWRLALLTFIILPFVAYFVARLGRRLRRYSTASQERMEEITSVLQETVSGIRIVKAFATERLEAERFRSRSQAYFRSLVRLQRIGALASPLSELMAICGALFVFWFGGRQVIAGHGANAEWFMIFLLAMLSLMRPVKNVTSVSTPLQEGVAACTRVFREMDREPAIRDSPGAREITSVEREIAFEGVSFAYDGGPLVLEDIHLRVARGCVVAIVGPSGGGKSTLVDLLPRFYDPLRGRITIDGVDLRDIQLSSLRRLMGIVSQETILFNDTVAHNIAYGAPGASQDEIEAAARAANAHLFVQELPQGYGTMVGDRGVKLSGGQRQRLAIARAILRNPEVLIFDEATSALDSESELLVQEAIDRLLADRTTFVIAHRLSTIQHADTIVVMDEGRIVQQGTHQELIGQAGLYRRLHEMQFEGRTARPLAAGANSDPAEDR